MVTTMKQSEFVYVVTGGVFTEFPEYSETTMPAVFTYQVEAEEYFEEWSDFIDADTIYEINTESLKVKRVRFDNGEVHEVRFAKCPVLFDAYQYANIE